MMDTRIRFLPTIFLSFSLAASFGCAEKKDANCKIRFAETPETVSLLQEALCRKSSVRTNALYAERNGKNVAEFYAGDFGPDNLQPLWSVSKFLLNTITGMAVLDGKVDLNSPVILYLPELKAQLPTNLTVRHLLFHGSGAEWKEGYEWNPFRSDVLAMLYGPGREDHALYVSKRRFDPGKSVKYSSGDSNLLSAVLSSVYRKEGGFPKVFFERMEIRSYVWETDEKGVPVGSSYAYLSPRDLAKIGKVYIKNGMYGSERIFPEDWIAKTSQPFVAEKSLAFPLSLLPIPSMGGHLYANRKRGSADDPLFEFLSRASVFGSGHWGQSLVIDPEKKLVLVRFGNDRLGRFWAPEFTQKLLQSLDLGSAKK
ncbi:class C beta-lactamase-related serine hydrolase [Leptospira fletcheri]|uniref:Class C beta-lactamase-related serine hydrolase n=1 Tax=Leptospira fletcheri TaxID=2484981 RepID=A0A4V3JDV5_9LEPT|nr:serine hydrolase [Leptospira fletcheri]TGK12155.1 class C beta-lactamase-related serine hydrolase [Leptospira fletcheri]